MKAVVAAFNQEKALVGAFSVITNLQMELFGALVDMCLNIIFTVRGHLEAELVLVDGAGAGFLSHLGAVLASASAGVALQTGFNSD